LELKEAAGVFMLFELSIPTSDAKRFETLTESG
jgi:hypothetical protein